MICWAGVLKVNIGLGKAGRTANVAPSYQCIVYSRGNGQVPVGSGSPGFDTTVVVRITSGGQKTSVVTRG